jgi:hypothetical protein
MEILLARFAAPFSPTSLAYLQKFKGRICNADIIERLAMLAP